ncbi:RDD family protein [Mycolicibacterium sp.]|uniref:RDD family protein n=1 Tax=Mycolicibacterium sp. TaxID=2320850 RepID=UPI003D0B327D
MTSDYPPQPGQYGQPGGYPPPGGGQQPGGLGLRFAARLIDGILVGIVGGIIVFALGLSDNVWITGLFSGLLTFIYFVALEVSQGWTIGKKILGLAVHGPGGAPRPTVQQSAIRNSWTLLSIIPFIGGLLSLAAVIIIAVTINGSPTKQGKHDELAGGTQVVKG